MGKKALSILYGIPFVTYLVIFFFYILNYIQPSLYFHHVQAPFVWCNEFLNEFFTYPGGIAELVADLLMQTFYYKYLGTTVFFVTMVVLWYLVFALLNLVQKNKSNAFWALLPAALAIMLSNNYNFPFSVPISVIFVLIWLVLFAKVGNNLIKGILFFLLGAISTYYLAGSAYLLLFSLSVLLLASKQKLKNGLILSVVVLLFSYLIIFLGYRFVFALASKEAYLYFFPSKSDFMAYRPLLMFFFFLASVPVLIGVALTFGKIKAYRQQWSTVGHVVSVLALLLVGFAAYRGHKVSYISDAKKLVVSDYCTYHNHIPRALLMSKTMDNYSFMANVNYNLAISKADRLNEEFFNFFQIQGSGSLYPDQDFSNEMCFVSSDYYYHIGYITEARHWAYEALVYYPYSPRAMQNLVKIHLITKEYKAAAQYLELLDKGLVSRNFVKKYRPYLEDTTLIASNAELMEKRTFIPANYELSPLMSDRLEELYHVNPNNKRVYAHLMLFCLLDLRFDRFLELYQKVDHFYDAPVTIYEEAILMYGKRTKSDVIDLYSIRKETVQRFNDFQNKLSQSKSKKQALNNLYQEYGESYFYYLELLYPHVLQQNMLKDYDPLQNKMQH
ncbi:MAG: DUF6057 family protein [Prolixibacteraceae bacterium]